MSILEVVNKLSSLNKSVATAESCTGGLIASTIVDVPGASDCFNEGYVTYSNEAKMKNLGVSQETLASYGAVSKQTACEMARGVRNRAGADLGIASTGIAGPGGGTVEKPVGLVYIACAYGDDKCTFRELHLSGDRSQVRKAAANEAIKLLAECLDSSN